MSRRLSDMFATWTEVLGVALRRWPAGAVCTLVSYPLSGLTGPLTAMTLGRVVDRFLGGERDAAGRWLGAFIAATIVTALISHFDEHYLAAKLLALVEQDQTEQLMAASLGAHGVEHLEDPAYAETLNVVRNAPRRLSMVLYNLRATTGNVVALVVTTVALISVDPLLGLAPVLASAVGVLRTTTAPKKFALAEQAWSLGRRGRVYGEMCRGSAFATEVRVLGLGAWAVERWREFAEPQRRLWIHTAFIDAKVGSVRALVHGIALAAGVAWTVHLASDGRATAGDVAMSVGLLQQVFAQTDALAWGAKAMVEYRLVSRALRRLLEYRSPVTSPDERADVPSVLREGISLQSVSFTYPGTDRAVLHDVRLHLPAGTTVALVGENGAGKSTLVKLLCRCYDPDEGRIAVDGIDLRAFDPDAWRRRLTGAFQDYARYAFLVREVIGVGDLEAIDDAERVLAAARIAGGDTVVADVGLETQLGREFPSGTDVSAGQWQKLALSRAAMRPDALLTLLDEPTAALDPRAEHDVFERFAALARRGRERGAITVLVSHRFSTARMADLIVVLHDGRVVEQGSHADLLAAKGAYAELYDLQARAYR